MKSKTFMAVILLLVTLFSGCVSEKTTITYRCSTDDGILYLTGDDYELLIDEIYGGGGIYGNFSVRDNRVLLRRGLFGDLGDIVQFKIDGNDLIDPDGDRWIRD